MPNIWCLAASSEPLLETTSDDVVTDPVQVFDRWVSLGDLIDLGVPSIVERSCASSGMSLVGCRLKSWLSFGSFCIKTTLLKNLALSLGLFLSNYKSVVKALGVEDALCVFSKFVPKQSTLLVLMSLTHMLSLVHIRSLCSIEGPIVLVDLIVW